MSHKNFKGDPHINAVEVVYVSDKPSRTSTKDARDCDINLILRRYSATGELPVSSRRKGPPVFGDVRHLQGDPLQLRARLAELQRDARDGFAADKAAVEARAKAEAEKLEKTQAPPAGGAAPAS